MDLLHPQKMKESLAKLAFTHSRFFGCLQCPNFLSSIYNLILPSFFFCSEAELESIFENASNGPVERVKKAKDFAFIHFNTRAQAEMAFINIKNSGLYLDGHEVEV